MSLNRNETEQTGRELRRHAEVTGLEAAQLGHWLGVPTSAVEQVLAMDGADPALVWLVRDALDLDARERGLDAGGWSTMTDANRRRAQAWFRLRDVPPRP